MKMKLKWTVMAVHLSLLVGGCSTAIVTGVTRSPRDWQFVQSVGGIALGQPARDERRQVMLPIRCDVSGTKTVTVRPTALNSALVCEPPAIRFSSGTVLLTIRTAVAGSGNSGSACPPADLGSLPAGKYSIDYLSPNGSRHPLGSIQIPH